MTTIKDIANYAGVSAATVSRILNQDMTLKVPLETRQKVIAAADTLHYIKKSRTSLKAVSTVGIVQWFSPQQEISDSYYLLIRQGIEDYCIKNGINIVRTYKADVNYTASIKDVDGLICIGKFSKEEVSFFKNMTKAILFLDMAMDDPDLSTITLDFDQAVTSALLYLKDLGHKRIGFLGGKEYVGKDMLFPDARKKVFIDFCTTHLLEFRNFLLEGDYSSESGYFMMNTLIEKGTLPTAVLAASDSIAIGALKALSDHQLAVPRQVSVIGFDDISTAAYTIPPLTTMQAPAYDMGNYGAAILHHMLKNSFATAMRIKLPCRLIIRETCYPVLTECEK